MATPLLNENKDGLRLLGNGSVNLDMNLPKFKIIHDEKEKERSKNESDKSTFSHPRGARATEAMQQVSSLDYETLKKFFIESSSEKTGGVVPDFELEVSDKMREVTAGLSMNSTNTDMDVAWVVPRNFRFRDTSSSFFERLLAHFSRKRREAKETVADKRFDIVKFFANVKQELSSDEAAKYRDRIKDYINCIGYCEKTSQTALKERMFQNLVINKYESILYAKGLYRAISFGKIIEFANKCSRNLCLDYIANYIRTIPIEVIKKKAEVDQLCVFDNYVILYYDKGNVETTAKTVAEKEKEVEKRKDPILFGVISDSQKLYYIDSWTDEYDDLTWDVLVEKLGEDIIKSDYIKDKIE